jgi:uncharacterized membrane protein
LLAAEPFGDYAFAFKVLMAIVGAAALVGCGAVLSSLGRPALAPLLLVAVSPLALGSVFLNRYDIWPAFLTVVSLALLLRRRLAGAMAVSALGTATKIFPAAALPPAVAWARRRGGAGQGRRAVLIWVGVVLAALLPFAAIGPGGLRFTFTIQATRHLETESLGGSLLLVADRLGLYDANIHTGSPGSLDVFGALPSAIGVLAMLAVIVAIVWITVQTVRRAPTGEQIVTATAAAITAYVAFGKVLSPQYLVWLVPLVPLVRSRLASVLLLAALVLTQIEFDHEYSGLHTVGGVVWVLLARNVVLAGLAVVLLLGCSARRLPDVDAVHEEVPVAGAT